MDDVIGYDMSDSCNAPLAICVDCAEEYGPDEVGDPIRRGDEWGHWRCACRNCGVDLDVTLVY